MSAATGSRRARSKLHYRLQRYAGEAAALVLGFVLLIWSVAPIYNMWMIALDSHDDIFSGTIWPEHPTLDSFRVVVTEDFWYLARFWHQFGNSFYVGFMVTFLTLLIGSLASFTVGRMRLRNGWLLTNAALMTYVIPASFLAIPFYRIIQIYGMGNYLWSVIAALTTFATPYAIFIFSQYGKSIPMELDESARIDGRLAAADLLLDLPAADGACIGCRRHIRVAPGVERISVQLSAAFHAREHDRSGRAGAIPQQ